MVQRIVRAVADREVVGAGIHDVGAGRAVAVVIALVIAGDVLQVDLDGHDFGSAGLEDLGLFKVHQLDGGFLDAARGVGRLAVDLDRGLAGHVADVGHLDVEGGVRVGGAGLGVGRDLKGGLALKLVGELGVAQAVAKAVGDLVVVVPLGVRAVRADRAGGVAVAGHGVIVAGLVVAVANVDVLRLDDVRAGVEAQDAAGTGDGAFGIGVVHLAHVLHGRRGHVVRGEDVEQTAGGADTAAQDIGHAQHAVAAGGADPQDGVNVGVVLQRADLDRSGAGDQHDDLVAGLFGQFDGIQFVLGQRQRLTMLKAKALGHATGQVVDLLAAGTGNDDDGGVAVLGKAVFVAAVNGGDLIHRGLARVVDLSGGLVLVMDVGLAQLLVDVHHGGVDVEASALEIELVAGPLTDGGGRRRAAAAHRPGDGVGEISAVLAQGLLQADVGALRLHAEAGAQQVGVRADAQQRDVGTTGQRQNAVVLQQDAALGNFAAVEVDGGLDQRLRVAGAVLIEQFGRRGELVIQRVFLVVFRYQSLAVRAQVGVDGGRVGLQGAAQDQRQAHGEARDAADATPHCLFARLFHGVLFPPLY